MCWGSAQTDHNKYSSVIIKIAKWNTTTINRAYVPHSTANEIRKTFNLMEAQWSTVILTVYKYVLSHFRSLGLCDREWENEFRVWMAMSVNRRRTRFAQCVSWCYHRRSVRFVLEHMIKTKKKQFWSPHFFLNSNPQNSWRPLFWWYEFHTIFTHEHKFLWIKTIESCCQYIPVCNDQSVDANRVNSMWCWFRIWKSQATRLPWVNGTD